MNIAGRLLCNSILKVCIDAAVRDELLIYITVRDERIVSKMSIVTVVLLDVDRVSWCQFFKCFLGFNGISRRKSLLEIYIVKAGEVVDKYGSVLVPLLCQTSFELSNESILRRLKLVNQNTFSRL